MPAHNQKATDQQLIESYSRTASVHKTGAEFDMGGASVHVRLVKLGAAKPMNRFKHDHCLIEWYEKFANIGKLDDLANSLGRTKQFIARRAKLLGLTDQNRSKSYLPQLSSDAGKQRIRANGHPRGMAGKTQSEEFKDGMSQRSFDRWHSMTDEERAIFASKANRSWKAGWRIIGGIRKYYRSSWEANYARYLEWLLDRGQIRSWKHEPKTFWFLNIKRGTRSYLPDFEVVELSGRVVYHEVKGWLDASSKIKLKRMAKYYPDEKIILIDAKAYRSIASTMKHVLRGDWE